MNEPVRFIHQQNVTSEQRVANILVNAARPLPRLDYDRICICASGPSLADHIEGIRARQDAGWQVAAMNGAYNFLQDHGIVADLFFMVDARPGVNLRFVSRPQPFTQFYIASQCDPEIFEALQCHSDSYGCVHLWQMFHDQAGVEAIQQASGEHRSAMFVGSLNVGHSCLTPIWAMGYKVWHLFGYDGSMRGDAKHAFAQPQNDGEPIEEFLWPMNEAGEEIPGLTKRYLATPTMAHAAQCFPDQVTKFRKLGVEIELFCDGLLPDMVERLASREGSVTAVKLAEARPVVPPARPRSKAVERLPVVTFKWRGHVPYSASDVNLWASQVSRHLKRPHELVCITDDPEGIDGAVRTIPMWNDHFEHGRDWHRLALFSPEMEVRIGPRFAVMDLDTVICGQLDPLFENEHPYMAWRDPHGDQYCTALQIMDAGAFPHVWEAFDPRLAIELRQTGRFRGYDQAWISYALHGQPRWTRDDGVLSFRADLLGNGPLRPCLLPEGARVVNFHGRFKPRDAEVQGACPWVAEHYR